MKQEMPEEFRGELDRPSSEAFDALWDNLDEALPEPPTGRMRRRLKGMIWRERIRGWTSGLSVAGMATALVVGLVLGRMLFPAPATLLPTAPDLRLETQLISGATTAARLGAIVNLREASSLPPDAAMALAGLVTRKDASPGLQIAALEALLAHAGQAEVQAVVVELLAEPRTNPMLEAMLREADPGAAPAQEDEPQGTTT